MNSFKPLSLIVAVFCLSALATAHGPAEKMVVVDSGAFGIYVHGARVATETFQIRQGSATSTATSELKLEGSRPRSVPNCKSPPAAICCATNGTNSAPARRRSWWSLPRIP